jgi:hypothetical protein
MSVLRRLFWASFVCVALALAACGGGGGSSNGGSGGSGSSSYTLTVTKSSAIGGTVTSTPAGISCDTTCTTQSASFTGSVSLSVTSNSSDDAVFTGWSGGGCSGKNTCSVTLSANTSVTANFVALSNGQLALFGASQGGGGTDFTGVYDSSGNPVDVSSSEYYFWEVIPASQSLVELDEFTSESWGSWEISSWEQDHQAFEILANPPQDPTFCDIKPRFQAGASIISSSEIDLSDYDTGDNSINGWDTSHFGIVSGNVYYQQPIEWDDIKLTYDIGGEYMMRSASGVTTTLLSRTDPDNQAFMDVADSGTLYAILDYQTSSCTGTIIVGGALQVWTRDLTTGHLATCLRDYPMPEPHNTAYRISNGYLYGASVSDNGSGSLTIWSMDLSNPSESPARAILATYPSTLGTFGPNGGSLSNWGVDNGHVVFAFTPQNAVGYETTIADLDTSTGDTTYYAFTSFNLFGFVPIWQSASSTSSGQIEKKRERPLFASFGEFTKIRPVNRYNSLSKSSAVIQTGHGELP